MYARQHPYFLHRRIPLALLFTVLLQLGAVVWWASMMQAQDHFRDVRLTDLEARRNSESERLDHILERLSRLEARGDAMLDMLQRVDTQLNRKR